MGVATGAERLQWRIVDLLAHAWDLVQATGVVAELPDDLVEQALTFAREAIEEGDTAALKTALRSAKTELGHALDELEHAQPGEH